ncbi:DNA polymerase Y family protein [Inhella sp.]|uniref:DNA polymerase Y family protein n=1 Tax=Inhella sp. TaxID=1921806 RepID=UPI0035B4D7CF
MRWLALLRPSGDAGEPAPPWPEALVWWALQFTPRVTRLEDGLMLELAASLRLFGGQAALQQRLVQELGELLGVGAVTLAWAPNSLAALALARAGAPGELMDGLRTPLPTLLDPLPFPVLSEADAHAPLLARLGCRQLADLRRLPRAALARRTSTALLRQLDTAYGEQSDAGHDWCVAPERFEARRELPQRSDDAAWLLQQAEPLLRAACLWLAARHAGCSEMQFGWQHDAMRARDIGPGGELRLAAHAPHRELRVWQRLLTEHLQRLVLQAPVSDLWLRIEHAEPLQEASGSLLASAEGRSEHAESLDQLLTRLAVRLGPEQVRQAEPRADYRPERQQDWRPWAATRRPQDAPWPADPGQWPQPSWLLNPPQALAMLRGQPFYLGALSLLAGPQRVETGWWDEHPTCRDYYLAYNGRAGLVWLFRNRRTPSIWYLQGLLG